MSVINIRAAQTDRRIDELRACDNIHSVHVIHRTEDGAAIVCVVPLSPQQPDPEADPSGWGEPIEPYLLMVDPTHFLRGGDRSVASD